MSARNVADGDLCPAVPDHGRMYVYRGRQWCPNVAHDKDGTPCWFDYSGKTAVIRSANVTPPPTGGRLCDYCKAKAPRGVEIDGQFGHPSCLAYLRGRAK